MKNVGHVTWATRSISRSNYRWKCPVVKICTNLLNDPFPTQSSQSEDDRGILKIKRECEHQLLFVNMYSVIDWQQVTQQVRRDRLQPLWVECHRKWMDFKFRIQPGRSTIAQDVKTNNQSIKDIADTPPKMCSRLMMYSDAWSSSAGVLDPSSRRAPVSGTPPWWADAGSCFGWSWPSASALLWTV